MAERVAAARNIQVARYAGLGLPIADLDGAGEVGRLHLAEALTYRIDTTRQLRAA